MSRPNKYAGKEKAADKHLRLWLEQLLKEQGIDRPGAWMHKNKDDLVRLTQHFIKTRN